MQQYIAKLDYFALMLDYLQAFGGVIALGYNKGGDVTQFPSEGSSIYFLFCTGRYREKCEE